MAEEELVAFRKRWKEELKNKKEEQRTVAAPSPSWDVPGRSDQRESKNRYFEDTKHNPNKTFSLLKTQERVCNEEQECVGGGVGRKTAAEPEDQPEYVSIARSLLDGRTSPLLDRIQEERTRRKRQYHSMTSVCNTILQQQPHTKAKKDEKLLDQFIQDLVWRCGQWW